MGILKEAYNFFDHTGSVIALVGGMNFLMWFGNTTILLMAGIMGIDTSLFEAAQVDGANGTQTFWQITMPLLRPIFVYVLLTSLVGGVQMFDVPQILTNGEGFPNRTTMTLIMYLNKHLFSKNYGMAGALSVMLFILTAILSLIVYRVTVVPDEY
jgi:multiple sugar transport system permease protein